MMQEITPPPTLLLRALQCLTAELDAYLNGVAMQVITGARNLDSKSVEAPLTQIGHRTDRSGTGIRRRALRPRSY
jgi:hypothetical protein